MEDPDAVLQSVVAFAETDPRVEAVVQTGSRARAQRVDELSDLDLELIGPGWHELASESAWIEGIAPSMVTLALANDEPDGAGWPTRLVVLDQGRKIDFTLAGRERLAAMVDGLDDLYDRGYVVHLDKTGVTSDLPRARVEPRRPEPPTQAEFAAVENEFWFEATQIAVYVARADLWVVKFREHTLHDCLLQMLEWLAQTDPDEPRFTWHIGHHIDEWLAPDLMERLPEVFTAYDGTDVLRGLDVSLGLFAGAAAAVGERLGLEVRHDLPARVRAHVAEVARRRAGL